MIKYFNILYGYIVISLEFYWSKWFKCEWYNLWSEANLSAVLKSRGTISSSVFKKWYIIE